MTHSIRWKFILIYFILVLLGMIIAGVFIIQSFEQYHYGTVDDRLMDISEIIVPNLSQYDDLESNQEEVQTIIKNHQNLGLREELFVVSADSFKITATSTENIGRKASKILEFDLLNAGLKGQTLSKNVIVESGGQEIRTKDMVFPIYHDDDITGLLYIRYDLKDINENLNTSRSIIVEATALAVFVTIILGFFIAKSITDPINDITEKASLMAAGHFNQSVEVKSDDEIGKLGETFNILTAKLNETLGDVFREKNKLTSILDYMDDGLIAVDAEGDIIHLNPKARALLKVDGTYVKKFDQFIETYSDDIRMTLIFNGEEACEGSDMIMSDDLILKVNYAPYKNEKNINGGVIFVLQDVTDAQNLENMRKEFVANVSHELKTPLTSIKSYAETILDGMVDDPEMQRQFLSVINSEADRMTRLVKDLLQLSNFDCNKIVMTMGEHDYVNLVNSALLKLDVTANNKKQVINPKIELSRLIGHFDHDRIEQVVLNILSNAIKYTPEYGEISVSVSETDEHAIITIEDNGMGIPDEDLERIFERFYRVDKARSREMGGTGLGLSIAKEIVELHNGKLEVASQVDKGTAVKIMLPLNPNYDI